MSLIEKLEAAIEGSRELDVLIHLEVTKTILLEHPGQSNKARYTLDSDGEPVEFICWEGQERGSAWFQKYTTSIDAALTLVPEGLDYELLHIHTDGPKRSEVKIHLKPYMLSKTEDEIYGEATTDALAYTVAALKARERSRQPALDVER